ncbi:hypothetical protein CVD28_02490 [Bacillus sp. M6-12]|uniref:hypothetical protein n=1 Tax=Bacillus sp. M6-12 TaxID=2054166 RepID=UPI000C75FE34|nr:hypothetical protein [Bacillus sp. M6-12]PLS19301.1 hypothetical protein CVD28_02490 [Bacillus sp. M6-12]
MAKFNNLETTLIEKWYRNLIDELVSENLSMNDTELQCLLSETIENRIKDEQLQYLNEGFVSELIGESFGKVDYFEIIQHYKSQVTIVTGVKTSELWNVTEGQKCEVLKSFFDNGEGWYKLKDIKTGEEFESPDIFWK